MLKLIILVLHVARGLLKYITIEQVEAAARRGEEVGELRHFMLWSKELESVATTAKDAGDAVASGSVHVDPKDDFFNRANERARRDRESHL